MALLCCTHSDLFVQLSGSSRRSCLHQWPGLWPWDSVIAVHVPLISTASCLAGQVKTATEVAGADQRVNVGRELSEAGCKASQTWCLPALRRSSSWTSFGCWATCPCLALWGRVGGTVNPTILSLSSASKTIEAGPTHKLRFVQVLSSLFA